MDSIYFDDPLGLLIELASYRFEPPFGYTHADVLLEAHHLRVERGDYNIDQGHLADAIEALVLRSRPRSRTTAHRRTPTALIGRITWPHTLSILKPSVNNLTTRIFVRAAGLDFDEVDVWGKKSTPEFLAKDPADLTPLLEEEGLPKGALWESCAIMQYLCNKHGLDRFYPTDPGERAMVDSAMFYLVGTLYPLLARATYPAPRLPAVRRRGRHLRGRRRDEGEGPEGRRGRARRAARGLPRVLPRRAARSSAATRRRSPTSASRRRSSSCARSTTRSPPGPRSTWRRSRRRSARRTPSPRRTCAGTSTTSGRRAERPVIRVCVAGITGWTGTPSPSGGRGGGRPRARLRRLPLRSPPASPRSPRRSTPRLRTCSSTTRTRRSSRRTSAPRSSAASASSSARAG